MAKIFEVERHVRHGHTDPAGIVYYPRYYEMMNDSVEDMFREIFKRPFGHMHLIEKKALPTVAMETEFLRPSYCDDVLCFCISVKQLGRSSVTFGINAYCGDEKRLSARMTSVFTNMQTMRSIPLDDALRVGLSHYLDASKNEENNHENPVA